MTRSRKRGSSSPSRTIRCCRARRRARSILLPSWPTRKLDEFRDDLDRFVRFYSFLSQVVPYLTQDSEKLYAFSRFLALRLREHRVGGGLSIDVSLTHYRLTEVATHTIKLGDEEVEPGTAIGGDGTGRRGDIPMSLLGELVELFNQRSANPSPTPTRCTPPRR